ncbi:MAG: 1-deoxy-D-xylulose-5-phosphate reductoisomerase, partial [Clostridia bacterium]|nr:1-deoxy-D-xylulose-5-phosphate reductoisomerase [Clostridia bacterium]
QLGAPDMRVPIAYAMSYPERIVTNAPEANFAQIGSCTFAAADTVRFPAIRIAYETLRAGGAAACMMNAANEEANAHFRDGKMKFTDISRVVENTLQRAGNQPADTIEQVYFADELARRIAREEMAKLS